jgi:tellurite resistance protein
MVNSANYVYSDDQISAWLRGLMTIAWADGHFDAEEQELMTRLTQDELAPKSNLGELTTIAPAELAQALGDDPTTGNNFLRTAVMMALANGVYSRSEADVINEFRQALKLEVDALNALESTLYDPAIEYEQPEEHQDINVLNPVKEWLDGIDIHDPRIARFVCKMVPPQCPFERDIKIFGHKVVHIPPMCKLNPLYDQLVGLRFRSLSYLADDLGEDITPYIS